MTTPALHNELRSLEAERQYLRAEVAELRQRHSDRLWPDQDIRYRALFEALAEGVVFHRRDGSIRGCNRAAEEILGLSVDQMLGRSSVDPRWKAIREDGTEWPGPEHPAMWTLQTGSSLRNQIMEVHKPDGAVSWLSVNTQPVFDSDPETPSGVIASFTDITELKHSQDELAQSERRLRLALSAAHMGIFEWDFATGRVYWTEEADRIFGLEPGTFEGTFAAFEAMMHPEDREHVERKLLAAVNDPESKKPFTVDRRIIRPDGEIRWTRILGAVIRDDSGRPLEMIGTVRDVTSEKCLEAQLRHSQRLESIGRLAGGVAHDFNNALSTILGSLALLDREPLSARGELVRDNARQAAEQAAHVCRRLLTFARRQTLRLQSVDMERLFDDLESLVRGAMPERIEVLVERPAENGCVRVDLAQLEQVVLNLAINARDAMPEGGRLRLAARQVSFEAMDVEDVPGLEQGDYVELLVEDTGHGMDEEVLDHLFEPFFTMKQEGTGLGLSICHGIVHQLGGDIQCDSAPGEGTAFFLYLPCTKEAPVRQEGGGPSPPRARSGETVLLVEDNDLVRKTTARMLRDAGYAVLEAPGGPEALQLASEHEGRIDALISDVVMPVMGGLEVASRIDEIRPGIGVMFVSGFSERVDELARDEHEGRPFLGKPFRRDDLLWTLRGLLDR